MQSVNDTSSMLARSVMERADMLGQISEEPDVLTRRFATPAMRRANDLVARWMREAGMQVREDNTGNLIARYEGQEQDTGSGDTLVLGSHLDTVRDAGRYDGPLGVLVALALVERLRIENRSLPFALEVVAFSDEEGLRFATSYLGSRAYTGAFDPGLLDLVDADGITMRDAISSYGGDPEGISREGRSGEDIIGYCEVHIEQGPVLEREGLPVAVVSAISGQTRVSVEFHGEAGHAGTVPMNMRRDALCAAAEFINETESVAREEPGLVATVGQAQVWPGASNVIPGMVVLSLDVRHMDNAVRVRACERLLGIAQHTSERRDIRLDWQIRQDNDSITCDSDLTASLETAVASLGQRVLRLPSGAGHDGVIMSRIAKIAMLFVRCRRGISHNPAESVEEKDVAVAIEAISRFADAISRSQNRASI